MADEQKELLLPEFIYMEWKIQICMENALSG
jgi:hypothetical protein